MAVQPAIFEFSAFCAQSLATWRLLSKAHHEETGIAFAVELSRGSLEKIQFPRTAPSYVFGLNGEYFSTDSLNPHCGIPPHTLPSLAFWFSSCFPHHRFSSIKIHQFDSSLATSNYKTLAFRQATEGMIYIAALGTYTGGSLHVKKNNEYWQRIPLSTRWKTFDVVDFQQITWPTSGIMYIVTVWCEKHCHWENISAENRCYLMERGIPGPEHAVDVVVQRQKKKTHQESRSRGRFLTEEVLKRLDVQEAISVLGLKVSQQICMQDIRRRFHECILQAHPDRAEIHRTRARSRGLSPVDITHARALSPLSMGSTVDTTDVGDSSAGSPWSARSQHAPEHLLSMVEAEETPSREYWGDPILGGSTKAQDLIMAKHILYDALHPENATMPTLCTEPLGLPASD